MASITDSGSAAATETTSGLTSFLNTLWDKAPSWIAAMIVFAVSFIVAKMVKEKVLDKVSEKFSEDDQDILVLIGRTTYVAVLAVGITIALSIAGIDLTAVIAAVGFGVGFAMQDLIMNFMAGVLILLNRQFTIGDFIKVNETVGQVVEIQSRATILKALDGTRVIVPNSDLFTNQVTSFTSNPFRRIEVAVGVEYRTDLAHAHQIILEALQEHQKVLRDPAPAIVLDQFADSSINFFVRFWVDSHSGWVGIKSDVIHLIKKHFDAEGIGIPFPIRTLVFDKDTENVVLPTYQIPEQNIQTHRDQRSQEEADLASAIQAAATRANTMNDIKPITPATPAVPVTQAAPVPMPQPTAPVQPTTETIQAPEPVAVAQETEEIANTGGALAGEQNGGEDVASVAQATQQVQAEQETALPAAIPESDTEDGANFLRANA
ncbi:MAG: mechanosensitive ion channel [Candidatus Peregrinibacteria bacterium]|nr:mechanosensitive ion channel [Candidatus Peregrinibacteria bacterium]